MRKGLERVKNLLGLTYIHRDLSSHRRLQSFPRHVTNFFSRTAVSHCKNAQHTTAAGETGWMSGDWESSVAEFRAHRNFHLPTSNPFAPVHAGQVFLTNCWFVGENS